MTLTLHEHPFASYCWKGLIAFYELDIPFERVLIGGEEDRAKLAEIWPMASIPVLVAESTGSTYPDSTSIVDFIDGLGEEPRLIPEDRETAVVARMWDRIFDSHVMTPMQKIVLDSLRPAEQHDHFGVEEARDALDRVYRMLDSALPSEGWIVGDSFTLAECSAAPALHYARVVQRWDEGELKVLTAYHQRLEARASVARVVDEAREYREFFPLGWPDDID